MKLQRQNASANEPNVCRQLRLTRVKAANDEIAALKSAIREVAMSTFIALKNPSASINSGNPEKESTVIDEEGVAERSDATVQQRV